jgi:hypothetical protein
MFRFVADIQLPDIGSLYMEKQQPYACCRILKMSINGGSTILVLAGFLIDALRRSLCSQWNY